MSVDRPALEEFIAEAICDGFWEMAELPERWDTCGENKRQVFRNCARRAIEAGKMFRIRAQARQGEPHG